MNVKWKKQPPACVCGYKWYDEIEQCFKARFKNITITNYMAALMGSEARKAMNSKFIS